MNTEKKHTAPCKTCENGIMHRKKKYVLGAGGAILRFMLMVPGVLMLFVGVIGMLGTGISDAEAKNEAIEALRAAYVERGLSEELFDKMLEDGEYRGDLSQLSPAERDLIRRLQSDYTSLLFEEALTDGAALLVGGLGFMLTFGGLVMMAFGFIIGIRKWKLICNSCGTSINAA